MNFFEHQDRARKQSRRLILAFIAAVVAIVVAVDGILLAVATMSIGEPHVPGLPIRERIAANQPLLIAGAAVTLGVIFLASLFKTLILRSGGGQVARQLGGTLVESGSRDAKRRRLRNVVEEIALASGVPVPEIYVLERESGINAFAAGYTPSDAAIAVTRGALDKLDRDELQGVIAHEFSHILNGDMRINIRLMGMLFGILLLALIGRRVLMHARFGRSDRNGAAVMLVALGLMAVGYVGLFFGRWIKAGVSRQREYLADAAAVQFTRDPTGIGGALKKIAIYAEGSQLAADTEEIGHMLFGSGQRATIFSTHPPLHERIRRIDPAFRPEELQELAAGLRREQQAEQEAAARQRQADEHAGRPFFDASRLPEQIGSLRWEQLLWAAMAGAALADPLRRAARSPGWAPAVMLYTLLDSDEAIREDQLLVIARRLGIEQEAQVRTLLRDAGPPAAEQRLPLLELAFPALKRHPPDFISGVLDSARAMVDADDRIEVFEYLLVRSVTQHLWDAFNPERARISGNRSLRSRQKEALQVLAVIARHGHTDEATAALAFQASCAELGLETTAPMPDTAQWPELLDSALPRLNQLQPEAKAKLVRGLAAAVTHDGRAVPAELELLRVTCDLIHVPLPLLTAPAKGQPQ